MSKLNFVVIGLLFSSILVVQSRILPFKSSPHTDFRNPALQEDSDDTNHSGLKTTDQITTSENEPAINIPIKSLEEVSTSEGSVLKGTSTQKPTVEPRERDSRSRHHHDHRNTIKETTSTQKPTVEPRERDSRSRHHHEHRNTIKETTSTQKPTVKPREHDDRSSQHQELTEKSSSLRHEPKNDNPRTPVNTIEDRVSESTTTQKPTINKQKTDDNTAHLQNDSPIKPESDITDKTVQTATEKFQSKGSFPDGTTPVPKKLDSTTYTIDKSTETATAITTSQKPWYKRIFS